MYYPGQIVYIANKKELAVFLGKVYSKAQNRIYDYEVLLHNSEEPGDSEIQHFELQELGFVIQPDPTAVTGTRIYYGPRDLPANGGKFKFMKKTWNTELTDEDYDKHKEDYINAMSDVRNSDWFEENYINTTENTPK